MKTGPDVNDPHVEAAQWLVRFEGGAPDDETRAAFEVWIETSPEHARAFAEARTAWQRAGDLQAHRAELLPQALPGAQPGKRCGITGLRYCWLHAAAASLVLALIGAGAYSHFTRPDFRTPKGQTQSFVLADGSRIFLDSGSAVDIRFDDAVRRIHLREGAVFVVAARRGADETRPLIVRAQDGQAEALGTQFSVERLRDEVRVSVSEHSVRVSAAATETIVHAGQSVRFGRAGLGRVNEQPLSQTASWRHGRAIFDEAPLSEVVAQLNRYRKDRIFIAGRALSGRRVSGMFHLDDPEAALETLCQSLELQRTDTPAGPVLYDH